MAVADLTAMMDESNRSGFEIERHTRNARAHLLEIKKSSMSTMNALNSINTSLNKLIAQLRGNTLAQLEKDRELLKALKGGKAGPAKPGDFGGNSASIGTAAIAAAAGLGVAVGALKGYVAALKTIGKSLKNFAAAMVPEKWKITIGTWKTAFSTSIADMKKRLNLRIGMLADDAAAGLKAAGQSLRNAFSLKEGSKLANARLSIGTAITNMGSKVRGAFAFTEDGPMGKALNTIKSTMASIRTSFTGIGDKLSKIRGTAVIIGTKVIAPIVNFVRKLRLSFNSILGKVKRFGSIVGKVAGVLAKVFAPLTILIVGWETIKGIIDGWMGDGTENSGILGALEGAIVGFATSLITIPADLIIGAGIWIAEKLGFSEWTKGFKTWLDKKGGFTGIFTDLVGGLFSFIGDAVTRIGSYFKPGGENFFLADISAVGKFAKDIALMPFKLLKDAFNKVKEKFKDANPLQALGDKLKQIGNMANDLIKSLLRSILPTTDGKEKWWKSITGIASAAIPNFIYDFAGMTKAGALAPIVPGGTGAIDQDNPFGAGGSATGGMNLRKSMNDDLSVFNMADTMKARQASEALAIAQAALAIAQSGGGGGSVDTSTNTSVSIQQDDTIGIRGNRSMYGYVGSASGKAAFSGQMRSRKTGPSGN